MCRPPSGELTRLHPVQKILGQHYIRLGRHPGAPKWDPGRCGRAGRGGRQRLRLCEGLGSFLEQGPVALCGADPRRQGLNSASRSRTSKCPTSLSCSLAWVWWTSCSRSRTETCTLFLRSLLQADTCPLFATVYGDFWMNFVRFSNVKVFSDPEVDSPLHLKIWIFNEPLVSDSHFPWSCQSKAFGRISRFLRS